MPQNDLEDQKIFVEEEFDMQQKDTLPFQCDDLVRISRDELNKVLIELRRQVRVMAEKYFSVE